MHPAKFKILRIFQASYPYAEVFDPLPLLHRVPVSWRPGVPDARKSRRDAEFWHAWRPLDAKK